MSTGSGWEVSILPLPPYVTLGAVLFFPLSLVYLSRIKRPKLQAIPCSFTSPPGGARGWGLGITDEIGGLVG